MVDPSLMRGVDDDGRGWVRCVLCGELHQEPFPNLYRDPNGIMWDECRSCAEEDGRP